MTLSTEIDGPVEVTDSGTPSNQSGDAFDKDGSNYPYSVDPDATIQELIITSSGDIVAEITTTEGDYIPLPLAGGAGAFDSWEIDSVTFKDPEGTTARIAGGWAGE